MQKLATISIIACGAFLLFTHSLGSVPLFDWDELNFAESAREMLFTGNFARVQINFIPFWEKPPLFFWMQSASMYFIGINETAARLPNAICGVVTLSTLYYLGTTIGSKRLAIWWVITYATSILPHFYFKSGIIDPWFNLFIFLSLIQIASIISEQRTSYSRIILSGFFAGLAVLTKGPVAILIIFTTLIIFAAFHRSRIKISLSAITLWILTAGIISCLWFGLEIYKNGWWFVEEFFRYQIRLASTKDAGHGGFLLYHPIIILFGCFPASVFLFRSIRPRNSPEKIKILFSFMWAALLAVLIIFTLVKTKILHYSSFTYFPITFLAAVSIEKIVSGREDFGVLKKYIINFIALIWFIIYFSLPILGNNIYLLNSILKSDPFARENLKAAIHWPIWYVITGFTMLAGLLLFNYFSSFKKWRNAFLSLFIGSLISTQLALTFFVPRIEQYTQHAAISFFQTLQHQDVYIETLDYKSYAHYYYGKIKPGKFSGIRDSLLFGKIDKPAYFSCRVTSKEKILRAYANQLDLIYEKNGFVFFKRKTQ